jgi:diguanylate cyclase (GGDEF)-like protein
MPSDDKAALVEAKLMAAVMDAINIGVIVLDQNESVVCWNPWVESASGIDVAAARGRPLTEVFPELEGKRVQGAARSALRNGYASILSQSLNKAPFPLFMLDPATNEPIRVQQAIHILPLRGEDMAPHCLIQIFDVTAAVQRERILREQALKMRAFSHIDGLTGIANRRRYDEFLESEFLRARRNGKLLSLIMIDIDHFKLYNDTYGHQAGDVCLTKIAQALHESLHRPGDLVARYGGEEFTAILPCTDRQGAYMIAETMRARVAALQIPHRASPTAGYVTISLGVASQVPKNVGDPDELQAAADKALYQAKHDGRNRIAVHGEGQAAPRS